MNRTANLILVMGLFCTAACLYAGSGPAIVAGADDPAATVTQLLAKAGAVLGGMASVGAVLYQLYELALKFHAKRVPRPEPAAPAAHAGFPAVEDVSIDGIGPYILWHGRKFRPDRR